MLLQPKKTKFKKYRKTYLRNVKTIKRSKIVFGSFGLKVLEACRLTSKQIETIRQTINRTIRRKSKLWIRIFPDIPVTRKPTENRMGKGKGRISFWCAPVKAGTILFELNSSINKKKAFLALKRGGDKLPVHFRIIHKALI